MQATHRLRLAFLVLVLAFLVPVAVAAGGLFMAGQALLAGVVSAAGLAGMLAGGVIYRMVRRDIDACDVELEHQAPATSVQERKPLRVQTMAVADLPPAYVAAVMQGAKARLSVLKAQARDADLSHRM
jgi:hypothetical protein